MEGRHAGLLGGRLAAAGIVATGAWLLPAGTLVRDDQLILRATLLMALAHVLLWLAPRRWPRHLGPAVWTGIALDIVWAAVVASAAASTPGPLAGLFLIVALWAAVGYSASAGLASGVGCSAAFLWLVHAGGADPLGAPALAALSFFWATLGFAVLGAAAGDRELRLRAERLEALHEAGGRLLRAHDGAELVGIAQQVAQPLMPSWSVRLRAGGAPSQVVLRRAGLDGLVVVPVRADGREFGVIECRRALSARLVRHSVRVREIAALETLAALLAGGLLRAELVADIERKSMTDGLTGLPNRRAFNAELDRRLAEAGRSGAPLSLCLIDIDHFKAYNDNFGHLAGDEALVAVAGVVARQSRAGDLPARYGGEEMAVILPATAADSARVVAERLRAAIGEHPMPHRAVTVSAGVATCNGDCSAEVLIESADRALYSAKSAGRNRVAVEGPVGARS